MSIKYFCCDEKRRNAVRDHETLNGIDYLEVLDNPLLPFEEQQRTLLLHFIKPLTSSILTKNNIRIDGGQRICNVVVSDEPVIDSKDLHILIVTVDKPGDFSIYTLRLIKDKESTDPPEGFDPILSAIDFSFKVNCPSDFDCRQKRICPTEPLKQPDINYLAKDYASFRQLMLDRMSLLVPDWKERNAADMGIALIEMLAFVGDHLSYQQDAATEAYLGTARRRVSVRRHARLVDYFMHNGCNARVWVQVHVDSDNIQVKKKTQLLTRLDEYPVRIQPGSSVYNEALNHHPEVFETMHDTTLFKDHNEMHFYTWGEERCCLPKGATKSTLSGNFPKLKAGDVLIFAEIKGPQTDKPEDADPFRRHAVRLTDVQSKDSLNNPLKDLLYDQNITQIEWHKEDALPFPLCISAITDKDHGEEYIEDVSIALGNIVLADHGRTIKEEDIGTVIESTESLRFRPKLKERLLTQTATIKKQKNVNSVKQILYLPFDPEASASDAFEWKMEYVLPAITLNNEEWDTKRDLLNSGPDKKEFVVEIEDNGTAHIRFGDDQYGMRPNAGTKFIATYRIGNGTQGNVGAETINHIINNDSGIIKVWNPLPARGGVDPESIEHVRQNAPWSFRTQERAVTPDDYAAMAERHPQVQKAAATFQWTGSWRTVFLTIDRFGGLRVDKDFKKEIRDHLEKYRMAGHDLEVEGPQYVPLEIEMEVCVKPDYFRSDVKEALLQVFNNYMIAIITSQTYF